MYKVTGKSKVSHAARNIVTLLGLTTMVAACGHAGLPANEAEFFSGQTYIPLNPLPVNISKLCQGENSDKNTCLSSLSSLLLDALPNETMRLSVSSVDGSASVGFSGAQIGSEGHSYTVIVDYIKYTTSYVPIMYSDWYKTSGNVISNYYTLKTSTGANSIDLLGGTQRKKRGDDPTEIYGLKNSFTTQIPIYIGVGLRIQANVQIIKGNVNLTLFGISAAAAANKLTGTLVVQTLGIHGTGVSALIPIPDQINQSSIQASLQALAGIKAKLYTKDCSVSPQIIGFESPYPDSRARQFLIGSLPNYAKSFELINQDGRVTTTH